MIINLNSTENLHELDESFASSSAAARRFLLWESGNCKVEVVFQPGGLKGYKDYGNWSVYRIHTEVNVHQSVYKCDPDYVVVTGYSTKEPADHFFEQRMVERKRKYRQNKETYTGPYSLNKERAALCFTTDESKPSKFSFWQFPKGTKVFSKWLAKNSKGCFEYTVHSLKQTGPDRWIIETEEYIDRSPYGPFNKRERVSFCTEHVDMIISRPSEQTLVFKDTLKEQKEIQHLIKEEKEMYPFVSNTDYIIGRDYWLDAIIICKQQPGMYVNTERLKKELYKQTFVKTVSIGKFNPWDFSNVANKKKVNRWIKQNFNRFLENPAKAQEEYDDFMNEMMDSDLMMDDY